MYKIAVLGDRDSIYGFAALGLDTYPVYDPTEAVRTLRRLAEGNYAVIYITEALAAEIDEQERFPKETLTKLQEMGMMGLPLF